MEFLFELIQLLASAVLYVVFRIYWAFWQALAGLLNPSATAQQQRARRLLLIAFGLSVLGWVVLSKVSLVGLILIAAAFALVIRAGTLGEQLEQTLSFILQQNCVKNLVASVRKRIVHS